MDNPPQQSTEDRSSRFRGAVLGAAIGEALAFPNLHYSRRFLGSLPQPLTSEYVAPPTGLHPPGQYGPATQVMLAVLSSIVESEEVSTDSMVSHMIPLWRDHLLVEREPSLAEAMDGLARGLGDSSGSGLGIGRAEAASVPRVVAVALWNCRDFDKLAEDAGLCTRITHRDPRCLACAAAIAAAIASNVQTDQFLLGPFLDRVGEAAGRYDDVVKENLLDFPRTLCQSEPRALRHLLGLCPDTRYPPSEDGLSEYCIPTAFCALYYFLRSPYNYEKAMESCLRLGGNLDVAAFLVGAISGALLGEERLPEGLTAGLLNGREIGGYADELHEALADT